ncbi:hypothetical protein BGZ81_002318 [Podila clonocystis]|nr:hypothetical protein BGZ81_002318 [Podila clonocystis]
MKETITQPLNPLISLFLLYVLKIMEGTRTLLSFSSGMLPAINAFSGIPYSKMTGFRAPLLSYSKATFDILADEKIEYGSSTTATF